MKKLLLLFPLALIAACLSAQIANDSAHLRLSSSDGASCIDSSKICDTCICPLYVLYVCGCNGVTYINSCYAENAGVLYWTLGACTDTNCSANFTFTTDSSGLVFDFMDASSGSYDSLHWNFGDGDSVTTSLSSIQHTYAVSGLYTVCLTIFSIDSSCNSTYCQTLVVAPPGPCPDTALIQSGTTCDTAYNPVCGCNFITYNNACEAFYYYGVTSWTPGACQIPPFLCQANYIYWLDSTGYTAHFEYIGAGAIAIPGNPSLSFSWNFGDGTTDTGQFPVHTYTDTAIHAYWVCLTISDTADSCNNTFCDSVRVGNQVNGCYAGFSYSIDSTGVVTVYPDSLSGAAAGGAWIIGGDTTNASPSFQVDSSSNYIICYVVTNDSMHCSDTVCINAQQIYAAYKAAGVEDISNQISQVYLFPNPASNIAEVRLNVISGGLADITVRNSLGEIVYQLPQLNLNPGSYSYTLNLSDLSGGVYLVEVKFNNSTAVRKLVKM